MIAIGGGTTPFPGNLALGATGSPELARRAGQAMGMELAAMGVNVNFAPVTDVNANPQNPVIGTRSFGEDPTLVARLSAAMVDGLQSAGIAATAKHFPGHGDTDGDTHHGPAVVHHDRQHLDKVAIPPFLAAIQSNVRLIMTAHVAFHALDGGMGLPATLSPTLLRGLLRGELGFEGVIVSDALNMAAIAQGERLVVDAIAATAAGVDLLLLHDDPLVHQSVYTGLLHATQRGLLSGEEVLASAQRVLALKRWLAERPQPSLDIVGCAEHQRLAFEIGARSITLVRDEQRQLPLSLSADQRIAVIVPQPIDLTPADTSSYETCMLAQFLRRYHRAVDEFVVPHHPSQSDIIALLQQIERYDLAIIGTINALGQPGQVEMVKRILATPVPAIVAALRMPGDLQAFPEAPAYICTYSLLAPSMEALAQALFGHIPFVGRLPVAIPGFYPVGYRLEETGAYQVL
ncbi:MAG: glycoside hydrolase family 3 [Herpetosiphonaceae bacterium]|nr:MAG: glycoside hydrolase family 3 [Herpetosiphonaceae bacterium]